MPHVDDEGELRPVLQPMVIRALKERNRVIDFGLREEMLEEMEIIISQRRTADTLASRLSHTAMESARESAEPVVRDRLVNQIQRLE